MRAGTRLCRTTAPAPRASATRRACSTRPGTSTISATLALDGRGYKDPKHPDGYFLGPTIFTDVKPGMTIAVGCGSRGIANIHLIIKAVVEFFRGLGAQPFIVAAMGSHGGGTSDGQRRLLADYGITNAVAISICLCHV